MRRLVAITALTVLGVLGGATATDGRQAADKPVRTPVDADAARALTPPAVVDSAGGELPPGVELLPATYLVRE